MLENVFSIPKQNLTLCQIKTTSVGSVASQDEYFFCTEEGPVCRHPDTFHFLLPLNIFPIDILQPSQKHTQGNPNVYRIIINVRTRFWWIAFFALDSFFQNFNELLILYREILFPPSFFTYAPSKPYHVKNFVSEFFTIVRQGQTH